MAAKKGGKKGKARKKPEPYYPAQEPGYPSKKAHKRAIKRRARSQIQPMLGDIKQRRREEAGAHAQRGKEIQGYYGFDLAARQSAQDRLQSALQGLVGGNAVMGAAGTEGLNAALRQQAEAATAEAQRIGGTAPGIDPALAQTMAAYGQAGQMGLAGDVAGYLGRGAADIGLSGIEARTAGDEESRRHRGEIEALTKERSDVRGRMPELKAQARSDIMQEQLALEQQGLAESQFSETKRTNRFGERMTRKQQKLAEREFGESKRARRFDEKMARKQAQLNDAQLELARQELAVNVQNAVGEQQTKQAETQAKQFDNAAEWLQGYLEPGDQDKAPPADDPEGKPAFNPKLWRKNRNFHEALSQLINRFGMNRARAYQILATSSIPEWRKQAERFGAAWRKRSHPH